MRGLTKGREFQLWEYDVSHGSLLVRSPAGPGLATSIDIICVGVEYIAAPRHLGQITVSEARQSELDHLERILQKKLSRSRVWALEGSSERFLVVAAGLRVREHGDDIFDSPFADPRALYRATAVQQRPNAETRLIRVLQEPNIGLDTIAVVADGISIDAKFNLWVLNVAKNTFSTDQMIDLLEKIDPLHSRCCAAAEQFLKDRDTEHLKAVVRQYIELLSEITASNRGSLP